jgi:hypothetical protein
VSTFLCVCGTTIGISGDIPNTTQWLCTSDRDFDAFTGLVDAQDVYLNATLMFRCPVSDHLWFFWAGLDEPPTLYAPTPLPDWLDVSEGVR